MPSVLFFLSSFSAFVLSFGDGLGVNRWICTVLVSSSLMVSFVEFFQAHQEVLKKLVDLIGITSIMEVSFLYPSLGSGYAQLSRTCLFLSDQSLPT